MFQFQTKSFACPESGPRKQGVENSVLPVCFVDNVSHCVEIKRGLMSDNGQIDELVIPLARKHLLAALVQRGRHDKFDQTNVSADGFW
ncbi:MAG TPA: hypothetical protein VEJ00_02850 [Candidatus Acidoferrales bacterium]|nr:hypothetical protein [Candidatus Acidoferrales bacterium]